MKSFFTLAILCLLYLFPCPSRAQEKAPSLLMATGRADSTGLIRLRWAVRQPAAWKQYNATGFVVERFTVLRDKKMLDRPERKLLTPQPLKPQPLDAWEAVVTDGASQVKNQYAAIIAQALYGENFDVGGDDGITRIINLSQELTQRHAFALYAADMDFEAACFAGWGLTDTNPKANEKYLYRIKAASALNGYPADSTGIFIGLEDYEPLPEPGDIMAHFGNRSVMLVWDGARLNSVYNAYYVERSVDDRHFERLSDVPVTSLNSQPEEPSRKMYLVDSLPDNATTYHYRIRGINSFGQAGPPSRSVSGNGRNLLPYAPDIRYAYVDEQGLHLEWTFDEQGNHLIKGFRLQRADRINGHYETFEDNISPGLRRITLHKDLNPSNYFTLTAMAREGESRTSPSILVQPVDSVPPLPPAGLTVKIDTSGIARLSWTANTEHDLNGYKIYRAMRKDEEPVPLTDAVWNGTTFTDTLNLNLINRKVYYAVSALDTRFNQSAPSALVEARKPTTIPPSPPLIHNYRLENGQLLLEWVNTSDEDTDSLRLYRKAGNDPRWIIQQRYAARSVTSYTDSQLHGSQTYAYVLEVSNDGGLRAASDTLRIKTPPGYGAQKQLTRLYARAQPQYSRIEISWDDKLPNISGYQIYRAVGEQAFTLWKTVKKGEKGIYDTRVSTNTEYRYAIIAVMEPGGYSEMKTITVKY